jgi:hypothetical protein
MENSPEQLVTYILPWQVENKSTQKVGFQQNGNLFLILKNMTTFKIYLSKGFFFFFFFVAGIEPRASHMLGKCCTTELHPSPPKAS